MTAAHNAVRARVSRGQSAPLQTLRWSAALAAIAQRYADELGARGCPLVPSGNRYGENLFWSSGFEATPRHIVASWSSEPGGHCRQVVSRATQRVGCGVARCGNEQIWVCNYDPPASFLARRSSTRPQRR